MSMIKATIQMLTDNRTYIQNQKIKPEYVVVHSTATGTDKIERLFKSWNRDSAAKSCHGMVDDVRFIQTLPYDVRGWHVGSNGNGLSVGFEICEPKNIAYSNASHSRLDTQKYDPNDGAIRADFLKRYINAVFMAAHMCRQTGIKPEKVLCHAEMHKIGKATNHADVQHWFDVFGEDFKMDSFRKDVKTLLATGGLNKSIEGAAPIPDASNIPQFLYKIRVQKNALPLKVHSGPGAQFPVKLTITQASAYTIVEEKDGWGRLKSGAGNWLDLSLVQRID
ncbi:MAG: N-acetylmuramoyl-L-alanine amidase [Christensenellales bacterium]|jgi:hypothetical protein